VACTCLCSYLPRLPFWTSRCSAHLENTTFLTRRLSLTLSQDILTGDEIISDSYDLKEIDGVAYEADCRKITIGGESFGAY
jgi:hypothetical protein